MIVVVRDGPPSDPPPSDPIDETPVAAG
jgi:hypothetical protein